MEQTETFEDLAAKFAEQSEPMWAVIVWNDPINLMSYVSYVFQKVFSYPKPEATKLMMDVHNKGRAHVYSGERTEAEQYVHKLHGYGLWATLESDR